MKTNIWGDFQICMSVPLRWESDLTEINGENLSIHIFPKINSLKVFFFNSFLSSVQIKEN